MHPNTMTTLKNCFFQQIHSVAFRHRSAQQSLSVSCTCFSTKTSQIIELRKKSKQHNRTSLLNDAVFDLKDYNTRQEYHQLNGPKQKKTVRKKLTNYIKPKQQPLRPPFSLFVTCLPGLEPLLKDEIENLRITWQSKKDTTRNKSAQISQAIPGGVKITVPTLAHLLTLRMYLGTASQIYIRLNDDELGNEEDKSSCARIPPLFRARGFPELERKLKDLITAQEWDKLFCVAEKRSVENNAPLKTAPWNLQVHVTTSKSKLIHTKAVEERVRKVIGQVLGIDINNNTENVLQLEGKPTVRLLVRIERDVVQLSLDTTTSPLHMRGYRKNPYKAPLREDLAYSLLLAGGFRPNWNLSHLLSLLGEPMPPTMNALKDTKRYLFDPCCGSGTIVIEGAGILFGIPPGRNAPAPLQGTSLCNESLWKEMKQKSLSHAGSMSGLIAANDIDENAIKAAKLNSEEGGVADVIEFKCGPFHKHALFSSLSEEAPELIWVVTNPPYGKRMSSTEIYKKLAHSISSMRGKKVSYSIVGVDPRSMRESGLQMEVAFSTKSGGMNVVAMNGEKK